MTQLMTPDHEQWEEFTERLEGPEGCNFHEDAEGRLRWTCDSIGHSFAPAILSTMPGIDVEGSLAYFREHGGFCDCEILFNVGR